MNKDTKVFAVVNGTKTEGVYVQPIKSKKNRHRVAVVRAGWRRPHWITVSTKKLSAA